MISDERPQPPALAEGEVEARLVCGTLHPKAVPDDVAILAVEYDEAQRRQSGKRTPRAYGSVGMFCGELWNISDRSRGPITLKPEQVTAYNEYLGRVAVWHQQRADVSTVDTPTRVDDEPTAAPVEAMDPPDEIRPVEAPLPPTASRAARSAAAMISRRRRQLAALTAQQGAPDDDGQ